MHVSMDGIATGKVIEVTIIEAEIHLGLVLEEEGFNAMVSTTLDSDILVITNNGKLC